MDKIAVKKCSSYDYKLIYDKITEIWELLGGRNKFINKGDTVLLKVNLLMGKQPAAAVTTHPLLVKAVARHLLEAGADVIIGDSPGGAFTETNLRKAYEKSGLTEIGDIPGVKLNFNTNNKKYSYKKGEYSKSFVIGEYAEKADLIINLPKLKTHGLTLYTGGVKNLFGLIPGLLKAEYHLKMPEVEVFSGMLVDLAQMISPTLTIMDAVVGMEGDGPSGGSARAFGYILAAPSVFALDTAGAYLLNINPVSNVPTIAHSRARGLPGTAEDIKIIGDELQPPSRVRLPEVQGNSNLLDQSLPDPLGKMLGNFLRPRPQFTYDKCVGCGICEQNCPPQAISMNNNKPEVDLNNCIRCFCCQELCPHQAVSMKRPWLSRLLFKFTRD